MKFELKDDSELKVEREVSYPYCHTECYKTIKINNKKIYVYGYGLAKCSEQDEFNKDFGLKLAEARAKGNFYFDYAYKLVELTYQPEWRKEKKNQKAKTNQNYKYELIKPFGNNFAKPINHIYWVTEIDGELYELIPLKAK